MHHDEGSFMERYMDLLTDPAHWAFEVTLILLIDVLLVAVLWPLAKRAVRRHDKKHHDHDCEVDDAAP